MPITIDRNYILLKKLLMQNRKDLKSFGKGIMDFPNKRLVSDDGTKAVQWAPSDAPMGIVTEITLNPALDINTLKKAPKVKKSTGKKSKKSRKTEPEIELIIVVEDPNRPQPPSPQDIPAGMSWVRRNLPAHISHAMPEDIRPNGPGRITTKAEAKLHGHGFWDIVDSAHE